jgi:hypothetical protein
MHAAAAMHPAPTHRFMECLLRFLYRVTFRGRGTDTVEYPEGCSNASSGKEQKGLSSVFMHSWCLHTVKADLQPQKAKAPLPRPIHSHACINHSQRSNVKYVLGAPG